jgi:hypothetical protein
MEKIWEFLKALVTDHRSLLILGGLIVFTLGVAGEVKNWVSPMTWQAQVAASTLGAIVTIVGLYLILRDPTKLDMRKDHGVKITSPHANEHVPLYVEIRGEIKEPLPEGKQLWLFRIWPDREMFVPMRRVATNSDTTEWKVENVHLGGKSKDQRYIGAYIVDESAIPLLAFFRHATTRYEKWIQRVVPNEEKKDEYEKERHLDGVKIDPAKLSNMKKAHEIKINRT